MGENEEEKLSCKREKWNYEMRKEDDEEGKFLRGKIKIEREYLMKSRGKNTDGRERNASVFLKGWKTYFN